MAKIIPERIEHVLTTLDITGTLINSIANSIAERYFPLWWEEIRMGMGESSFFGPTVYITSYEISDYLGGSPP